MPIPENIRRGPWPKGQDNVSPDHAVAEDALRSIVNCDVMDDGTIRRRGGLTLRVGGQAHSAWPPDGRGGVLYAVVDGVLTRYTRAASGALTGTPIRTGMSPDLPVAYLDVGGEVYYTNGAVTGKIVSGLDRPWGVERPSGPPSLAAMASGALFAGRYQVAVTFVGTTGEESGCGLNEPVDVADGGGISVTKIPQPISGFVNRIRIYVTEANGEVPYHYADLAVGTTALFIGRSLTLGMALATQFLMPPVPGYALEHYNGRIYIARSNLLFFTEAMAYGHMRQQNFLAFDDEVRIVKAADPGIFVATASRTFFLQGSGPADFQLLDRLSYGAARGAVAELPGRRILWIGAKGPVVATQDGEIEGLTDDQESALRHLAMDDHERGSVAVRDRDGVRQIVAAMGSEVASSMTAQDYFDIEIIRKT